MSGLLCPVFATSFPLAGSAFSNSLVKRGNPTSSLALSRKEVVSKATCLACMGYSSSLIYRNFGGFSGDGTTPLILYGSTLLLDWVHRPLVQKTHNKKLGIATATLMAGSAVATVVSFYKADDKAAYLMIPFLLWTLYETSVQVRRM
ncbi:hypothetical protein ACF0H5_007334 [Mactra antiquata]